MNVEGPTHDGSQSGPSMYFLRVFKAGAKVAHHTEAIERATVAFQRIQALLAKHADCERVEVHMDQTLLFKVDCHGNRID